MKRIFYIIGSLVLVAGLISWGAEGHRMIGAIAENHLTPQAKAAVQSLLGNETLADASTWADEVKSSPDYRYTASWHFLNLDPGLSFEDFKRQVEGMGDDNIYSALLKEEGILRGPAASQDQKKEALKFIIHFVGDMHQPMHISRASDKGGNKIQMNYNGRGTNLHTLWDSKLLEHDGRDYNVLAREYDKATPAEINKWQSDPVMVWIWESYQISSELYAEVDKMNSRIIDDSYFQAHIGIVRQRIDQAGIRLAGLLNDLFKNAKISNIKPQTMESVMTIKADEAGRHVGEVVKICSKVYGHKEMSSMVLVNLGGAYPDQLLTIVLRGDNKAIADNLDGKLVCVTGKVVLYRGKPEISVTSQAQIVTE